MEDAAVHFRLYLPDDCIGKLVGKAGCNISAVRELTKVKVNVANDDSPRPSGEGPDGMREMTVIGTPNMVSFAAHLLMSFALRDASSQVPGGVFAVVARIAVLIEVEPDASIWSEVQVHHEWQAGAEGRILQLEARPLDLMKAVSMIGSSGPAPAEQNGAPRSTAPPAKRPANAQLAAAPPAKPARVVGFSPYDTGSPQVAGTYQGMAPIAGVQGPQTMEAMELPHKMMGRVIGKGGSGLKLIREASGCTLDCKSDQGLVNISGPADAIAVAKCLIHMRSAEPYPSTVGDGSQHFEWYVPQGLAGRIIGKGGENLKQCRERHNAQVQVLPIGTPHDPSGRPIPNHVRYVSVTAPTPESVKGCLDFLTDLIHSAVAAR
jgi:transcription antitermination factor NusA-like protein